MKNKGLFFALSTYCHSDLKPVQRCAGCFRVFVTVFFIKGAQVMYTYKMIQVRLIFL